MSDMSFELISGNIENFELNISLFRLINSNHLQSLDGYFLAGRFLGRGEIIVLLLLLFALMKRKEDFKILSISSILTAFFVIFLKNIIQAPRPALLLEDINLLLPLYHKSFPSGDTAVATLILLSLFGKASLTIRFLLVLYWVTISYGRIYLGVHFPLDILGGFLIAFISFFVVIITMKKWEHLFICKGNKKLI